MIKFQISKILKELYKREWISTRDGNISFRPKNKDFFWITPSGVQKNKVMPWHLVKVKFDERKTTVSKGKPSGELHMHHMLVKHNLAEDMCVLHAHPTYIITAMEMGYDLQDLAEQFPEVFRYTKVGPTVPFMEAISQELGDAVFFAFRSDKTLWTISEDYYTDNIVGLKQHGVTALGKTPQEAFEHIERLEHIAKIAVMSGLKINSRFEWQDGNYSSIAINNKTFFVERIDNKSYYYYPQEWAIYKCDRETGEILRSKSGEPIRHIPTTFRTQRLAKKWVEKYIWDR